MCPPSHGCSVWPCPHAATHKGKCAQHATETARDRNQYRGSPESRGYGHAWRRFRKWYLAGNPFCVECEKDGRVELAAELDHIKPLEEGGELLDPDNVQGLCHHHHRAKTERDKRRRKSSGTDHH